MKRTNSHALYETLFLLSVTQSMYTTQTQVKDIKYPKLFFV